MASIPSVQQERKDISIAFVSKIKDTSSTMYKPDERLELVDVIAYDSTASTPPIVLIYGAKNYGKTTSTHSYSNCFFLS